MSPSFSLFRSQQSEWQLILTKLSFLNIPSVMLCSQIVVRVFFVLVFYFLSSSELFLGWWAGRRERERGMSRVSVRHPADMGQVPGMCFLKMHSGQFVRTASPPGLHLPPFCTNQQVRLTHHPWEVNLWNETDHAIKTGRFTFTQ